MPIKQRESSVTVKSDWVVIEEMEKTQLAKLSLPTVIKLIKAEKCDGNFDSYIVIAGRRPG